MKDRSIRFPVFVVFTVFAVGVLLSFVSAYNSASGQDLHFCLSEECIKLAKKSFENSLWLLKTTMDICVALATVLGVYYALRTYIESVYSRVTRERAEHFKGFCGFVDSAPQDFKISMSLSQKRGLYFMIYPQAESAIFSVSEKYTSKLHLISSIMDEVSKNFGRGGFDKKEHAKVMYREFSGLFLDFEEPASRDVFADEIRVCGFLDFVNSSIPELNVKLSGERHYRVG
ncbi:retron Ec48 family effector membrane protein [Pseudomonas citronellolis]|uniref:retron Ec48 family effector membrane protein n=1 Tax=Pseudomonas citronellolis TaxID=53408 RepID=UPI0021135F0C|nr:retron Ec48 family effector membrane protein [Pseudomonas citronellolis]UUC48130.1 retron Ec48 family effector membrane protein [Pseudomonas citronellolis]